MLKSNSLKIVAGNGFPKLAKKNTQNLSVIECEIWATNFDEAEDDETYLQKRTVYTYRQIFLI